MSVDAGSAPERVLPSAPSHDDLLAIARVVRAEALGDDAERVRRALARLRADLVRHVRAEEGSLSAASVAARSVVRDGQSRLLALLDAALGDVRACTCLVRTTELEIALRRQARLEALLIGHEPRRPGPRAPDGAPTLSRRR